MNGRPLGPLLALVAFAGVAALAADPYVGALRDGTAFTAAEFAEEVYQAPTLKFRAGSPQPARPPVTLDHLACPVRWLGRASAGERRREDVAVEFHGGDRLPGRVVEFRDDGADAPLERQGPHLVVEPLAAIDVPDQVPRTRIGVRADAVRRIVWRPVAGLRHIPATVFLGDGRRIPFRSLLWAPRGVIVLTADDTREIPFAEIAELHLAARDPWEVYVGTLARICPAGAAQLVRIETPAGLVVTDAAAPLARPDGRGWGQRVWPAWSIEPFWIMINNRTVASCRWFAPQELPLSLLDPARAEQRSLLEGAWPWQADAAATGGPLSSAGRAYGWGLGTLAATELEFALPAAARGFRAQVGIDDALGRGGRARALVYRDRVAGAPVWQSGPLVGGEPAVDTGVVALPAAGDRGSLVLVSDPASPGEPAADPLNVRDLVDWLEPTLDLDPGRLAADVQQTLPGTIPAWRGWDVSTGAEGRLFVRHWWDAKPPFGEQQLHRRTLTVVRGGRLVLGRRLDVGAEEPWLCVAVGRVDDPQAFAGAGSIEVRVEGVPLAAWDVPARIVSGQRGWRTIAPRMVPLSSFVGRTVTLEVEHRPTDDRGFVEWSLLEPVASPEFGPWTPVEVVSARSATEAPVRAAADGIVTVATEREAQQAAGADRGTVTVVADTPLSGITGFRLEVLPAPLDPRTPAAPRRGALGLGGFGVTAAPRDDADRAVPVPIGAAVASDWIGAASAAGLLDARDETGWKASPLSDPHTLVLSATEPVGFDGGTRLTFTLGGGVAESVPIERFRLSVTQAPFPFLVAGQPAVVEPPAGAGRPQP